MIVATYNCGCPVPTTSPSTPEPLIEAQPPCSPCCVHPRDASRHRECSQLERSRRIRPTSGETRIFRRVDDKSLPRVSPDTARTSAALSSSTGNTRQPPCCDNCCAAMAPSSAPFSPELTRIAMTRASRESVEDEREPRNGSKSRELEMFDEAERTPVDKIVSEIARTGQPYKEIEAVINDNRVVIRMHKEPVREEYTPPCECVGQDATAWESTSRCDDGAVFEMADGNLELCRVRRENAESSTREGRDRRQETACRTITLYPRADAKGSDGAGSDRTVTRLDREADGRSTAARPIDIEENPNIFLLRIRKLCDSGDRRHKIDLEFRAPRPWRNEAKRKLCTNLSEKVEARLEKSEDERNDAVR